jgi:hypothetical protein
MYQIIPGSLVMREAVDGVLANYIACLPCLLIKSQGMAGKEKKRKGEEGGDGIENKFAEGGNHSLFVHKDS